MDWAAKTYDYLNIYTKICCFDTIYVKDVSLCRNILFFNKETRVAISNYQDTLQILKLKNGYYQGIVPNSLNPKEIGSFSYIFDWLPNSSDFFIISTIIHEIFHSLQETIGLNPESYHNDHMDQDLARTTVRLEWYYLKRAILYDTSNIKQNIDTAIFWRNYRRDNFRKYSSDENRFEIHEGLPKFFELKYTCPYFNRDLPEELISFCEMVEYDTNINSSFIRSFGYCSGSMYSYLLDKYSSNWIDVLDIDGDLAELLSHKLDLDNSLFNNHLLYSKNDTYIRINQEELNRKEKRLHYKDSLVNLYKTKTRLYFKLGENFIFNIDPNSINQLDSMMFIPHFEANDSWGIVKVFKGGGFFKDNYLVILVDDKYLLKGNTIDLKNDYFEIELNPNWQFSIQNEKSFLLEGL